MATPAEKRVLELLDLKGGNVQAVAKLIGNSESYVNRIKKSNAWRSRDDTLIPVEEKALTTQETIAQFLPPNLDKVTELRDANLEELILLLRDEGFTVKDRIALATAIWKYETTLRQAVQPSINAVINQDNRSVHITSLVDELETRLSPEALRKITGTPEPLQIVEGEVVENENEDKI
jgi:hypothetical protein